MIQLPEHATRIAVGGESSCAILASGQAACWGQGDDGTLGDTMFMDSSTPTMVVNLHGALDITASISHVCATLSDGGVACWGDNVFLPDEVDYYGSPRRVEGIANAVDVTVGAWYTCALRLNVFTIRLLMLEERKRTFLSSPGTSAIASASAMVGHVSSYRGTLCSRSKTVNGRDNYASFAIESRQE